jgi:predicted anti-sigma-YlaC factor YlaD
MNCSTCQNSLVAYLEEKLPVDLRSITTDHLNNCKSCSELFNELNMAYRQIEAEKAIECNPFLVTRVMAAIENQEIALDKKPALQRILQTALIAVSISIAVLGGIEAGSLYSVSPKKNAIPDEMVFMNDAALESLNNYTTE